MMKKILVLACILFSDISALGFMSLQNQKSDFVSNIGLVEFNNVEIKNLRVTGPVSDSHYGKFETISITGSFEAKDFSTNNLYVTGPVNIENFKIDQAGITGNLGAKNGTFRNLNVTGPITLENVVADEIKITGISEINDSKVKFTSRFTGSFKSKNSRFEDLIITAEHISFNSSELKNLFIKKNNSKNFDLLTFFWKWIKSFFITSDDPFDKYDLEFQVNNSSKPQYVYFKGKAIIEGDIAFEGQRGFVIVESPDVKIKGKIFGGVLENRF